jgi:hypothetical protein
VFIEVFEQLHVIELVVVPSVVLPSREAQQTE